MNKKIFILFLSSFILLSAIYHLGSVFAFTFQSDSYIIDWGNFNITSGKKTSTNYGLTDTVGQNSPGRYTSTAYVVKAGFQYVYENMYPFSFTVDNLSIDFGNLVPEVGTTAVNHITVTSPAGHGYQIMVAENHPLQNISGTTIPDTTGDNGLATEAINDTWANADTYGFVFNANGHGTSSYFPSINDFRQFANAASNETPQIIMSENSPQHDRSAAITYKINVSSQQSSGTYQNATTFIAIPKY